MGNCSGHHTPEPQDISLPVRGQPSTARGQQQGLPPRIKVVLLGDAGVGKSCLALRYVHGIFQPASKATVGASFLTHTLGLPDGRSAKLDIWDTAGQERYASLAPLYYRGAHGAIVVYDVTNAVSFERAKFWVDELQRSSTGSIVMVLVGNKTDLWQAREVSEDEGREYSDRNMMMFVETSAKTASNVNDVFEGLARTLAGGMPVSSNAAVLEDTPSEGHGLGMTSLEDS